MIYGEDEGGTWADQVTPPAGDGEPVDLPRATMRDQEAGWYPDPLAPATHQRWWTGERWDAQTNPPDGPALPGVKRRRAPRLRRRPLRGLRRLLTAVVAAALLVTGLGFAAVVSDDVVAAMEDTVSGRDRSETPTRPVTVLPLPGVPTDATVTCTQHRDALSCRYLAPAGAGTATCSTATGGRTGCVVRDDFHDTTATISCTRTRRQLTCRPTTPAEVTLR